MTAHEFSIDLLKRHTVLHFATDELINELAQLKQQADLVTPLTEKYLAAIEAMNPAKIAEMEEWKLRNGKR